MGASPEGSVIDELTASFNRTDDVARKLLNNHVVHSFPDAKSANVFLSMLSTKNAKMNHNFENTTLEYELFPGDSYTSFDDWDEYNSNCYIFGVLQLFGYSRPASGANTPGYQKPIPTFVFDKRFNNDDELKKEWKKHYPDF